MASDEKPGTKLASGSAIMVALVATGFYFFHREAPLVDMRPLAEARLEEHAAPQEVEARLWQDPIGAVDKFRDRSGARDVEQKCLANPLLEAPPCKLPLGKNDKKTLVLGVTVSGAPYPEDIERRRRTRYAVLAGLEQARFGPEDRRHIGYFVWSQSPSQAPFLSKKALELPLLAWGVPASAHFACVSAACVSTATMVHGVWPLFSLFQSLPDAALAEPAIVPYERFKRLPDAPEANDLVDSVLVLWLKDDVLMQKPLTALDALVGKLHRDQNSANRDQNSAIKFIGPSSSDMLQEMVNEALAQNGFTCSGAKSGWRNLDDVRFYSYLAGAPDEYLFGNLHNSCGGSLQNDFENLGIHLQRTVATEDTLAKGIRDELSLRRIDPVSDHIALISEWDTLYGQTLPKAVEHAFAPDGPTSIHKFTYLRGLDGLLPSSAGKEDAKQEKSTNTGTKTSGSSDFFKIENDTQSLERPIGESQYDYLRRISAQLHKVDDDLRKQAHKEGQEKKIKAIGVLGGDVFDKLLILRALRPEFPEALFFTTDFDEAFTIKSELPFTRNLLISSSFGPNLSEWLQGDIPFFRDTYQASAFLATQVAVGHLAKKLEETPNHFGTDLSSQLRVPRLFEVKRNGEVLQFAWGQPSSSKETDSPRHEGYPPHHKNNPLVAALVERRSASPCLKGADGINCDFGQPIDVEQNTNNPADPKPCWNGDNVTNCGYIQPVDTKELKNPSNPGGPKVIEKPFPTLGEDSRKNLPIGLALGAVLGLGVLLGSPYVRKHAFLEVVLLILGLGVGSWICINWEPIAQHLTEKGEGEPIAILDGVSVWPTILLRGLGIILSIYFFLRIVGGLGKNLEEIAWELELRPKPEPLWRQLTGIQDILTFWKWLKSLYHTFRQDILTFWKWLRSLFQTFRHNNGTDWNEPLDVEAAWWTYVGRERFWPRFIRAALCTALMIGIFIYVLEPMFGVPAHPTRGPLAFKFYFRTTIGDVLCMDFLTFFVFDATLSCLLFVNKLRRAQSLWPQATLGVYKGRLQLQTNLIHDWIDLDFVAKRTKCIGSLIYFPFVLIALLIVSRSTIFANYAPSLTILIAQGITLSIVFSCAIMMCWVARATRDIAKQHLTEGIIRAKDAESKLRLAEQLEKLLVLVAQLNGGAFSPLTQQPLVKALLFPLSSAGWVALIENGTLSGL
ncbi:MAG TPA: hypothetical protein VHT48_05795 [Methylocella sp.]|nr:hypothetical protein [Methylocella sp.]